MNKKIVRVIDELIKSRLKLYLNSNEFKQKLTEATHKEIINILLENSSSIKSNIIETASVPVSKPIKNFPKLPTNNRFTKDNVLNSILNDTANDPVGMSKLDYGNPLVSPSSVNIPKSSKPSMTNLIMEDDAILSEFNSVKNRLQPNINNAEQIDLKSIGQLEIENINTDQLMESMAEDPRYSHIYNALNRDYSELLKVTDDKVKNRRPVL